MCLVRYAARTKTTSVTASMLGMEMYAGVGSAMTANGPSEIAVDWGMTREIRLTSEDTDHGFRILDTDINVAIPKRGRGEVTVIFDAREPGDYTFECSQMCGAGHSFMRGQIRVRPGVQSSSAGVGR